MSFSFSLSITQYNTIRQNLFGVCQDELFRIREKISLVKRRKQDTLDSLEDELQELRLANDRLQEAMDKLREEKMLS